MVFLVLPADVVDVSNDVQLGGVLHRAVVDEEAGVEVNHHQPSAESR